MIWLLILAHPLRYAAGVRNDALTLILGPRCKVTGDRVYPRDRAHHEYADHYGEGPCA